MPEKEIATLQAEWVKTALDTIPKPPNQGLTAHYEFDGYLADTSGGHHHGKTLRGEVTFGMGKVGKAAEFNAETRLDLGDTASFDRNHPFALAVWINQGGSLDHMDRSVLQKMDPGPSQTGYELAFDNATALGDLRSGSHYIVRLVHQWPEDAIEVQTRERVPLTFYVSNWHHFIVNYDGSGKAAGLRLYLDGKPQAVEVVKDHLTGSFSHCRPSANWGSRYRQPLPGFPGRFTHVPTSTGCTGDRAVGGS